MTQATQTYWHLFSAYDYDSDLYAFMLLGDVPLGADDPSANGLTPRNAAFPMPIGVTATYRATFDHEPTQAELDDLAPEGHRSWEQE